MEKPDSTTIPPRGFYYHYKHDPAGVPNNYTYEVVGIGRNTEDDTYTVLYRPLYESEWMPPADLQSRPFEMFIGTLEKDGQTLSRFTRITDPARIAELKLIVREMYPTG